jgi:ubiquitin C-terminal hydrolase
MTQWQKIDKNIKADHKSKFRRIDFRLATTNTLSTVDSNLKASSYNALQKVKSKDEVEDEISGPIPGLLDPKLIIPILKWNGIRKIAPGFFNSGNTCYLNSTLQCLLHVPALSQYIIQDSPIPKGSNADNNRSHQRTIFDIYQHIVADVWVKQSGKTAIRPSNIVQNIKRIGKHFRPGRQEDAHEFLRLLLDSIHEDILKLKGIKSKGGGRIAETTLISRVFGGHIRNELKCNKCSYKSRTYNHILDLSIDLQGISSVKESLKAFIKPETLGKGNEWKCEKCNIKVQVNYYIYC